MLVLQRKQGEKVVILLAGQRIEILVAKTGATKVKLGIAAPSEARIIRDELAEFGAK